jgi:hypothetical protein
MGCPSPRTTAAIASNSWRSAFMVCADGLRMPKSARKDSNYAGRTTLQTCAEIRPTHCWWSTTQPRLFIGSVGQYTVRRADRRFSDSAIVLVTCHDVGGGGEQRR